MHKMLTEGNCVRKEILIRVHWYFIEEKLSVAVSFVNKTFTYSTVLFILTSTILRNARNDDHDP